MIFPRVLYVLKRLADLRLEDCRSLPWKKELSRLLHLKALSFESSRKHSRSDGTKVFEDTLSHRFPSTTFVTVPPMDDSAIAEFGSSLLLFRGKVLYILDALRNLDVGLQSNM